MRTGSCVFSNVEVRKALWEVTAHCPLACKHCSMDAGPRFDSYFDVRRLEPVLDALAARAVSRVILSGGEPFAHPELGRLVAACVGNGIEVSVSTSGYQVGTDELERSVESGLRKLTVSADGSAHTHDARRGRGSYESMVTFVRRCTSLGVGVTLNLVIGRDTSAADLFAVTTLAQDLNVTSVVYCFEIDAGRGRGCSSNDSAEAALRELSGHPSPGPDLTVLSPRCNTTACPSGKTIYFVDVRGVVHDRCVYAQRVRSRPVFETLSMRDLSGEKKS